MSAADTMLALDEVRYFIDKAYLYVNNPASLKKHLEQAQAALNDVINHTNARFEPVEPAVTSPTDVTQLFCASDELAKLANSWRPGQQWQAKVLGAAEWTDLPLSHRPGWFHGTQYRQRIEPPRNPRFFHAPA